MTAMCACCLQAVDIFSCGVCLYYMIFTSYPSSDAEDRKRARNLDDKRLQKKVSSTLLIFHLYRSSVLPDNVGSVINDPPSSGYLCRFKRPAAQDDGEESDATHQHERNHGTSLVSDRSSKRRHGHEQKSPNAEE